MAVALHIMSEDEVVARGRHAVVDGFGRIETSRGQLPLAGLEVRGRVTGLLAETKLVQRFVNAHDEPLEATYIFPLPARAAVTRFRLMVAGRVVEGELKERGQARREYSQAIAQGHRAAIAEEERPETFTMRVGNLPPGEEAVVELTMVAPLQVDDGEATFRFPLVVAPRYIPGTPLGGEQVGLGTSSDTDAVPDASRISPPVLLPGFPNPVKLDIEVVIDKAGLPLEGLESSLHAVVVDDEEDRVRVRVQPGERVNRDFLLRFAVDADEVTEALIVSDDEDGSGCGTAVLLCVPPRRLDRGRAPRDVVFVLDRSGSMQGWKMVAARRALARMVDTLSARDRFAVLAFDTVVERFVGQAPSPAPGAEAGGLQLRVRYPDGREEIVPLGDGTHTIGRAATCPIQIAHPGISRAHAHLVVRGQEVIIADLGSTSGLVAGGQHLMGGQTTMPIGGQAMLSGVTLTLELEGQRPGGGLFEATDRNRFRAVEYLTKIDARGGTEMAEPLQQGARMLSESKGQHRDPILVLVTDGQVGNEAQILRHLEEAGGARLRTFTVGIDRAVNAGFLERLADMGGGRCELVESEDRLDEVMDRLHRNIDTPVLVEPRIDFQGLDLEPDTQIPGRVPALFAGAPLVIAARYTSRTTSPQARLQAARDDGSRYESRIEGRDVAGADALSAVWARGRIRELEDRYDRGERGLTGEIVDISTRFGVLSRFTAYVAVDRAATIEQEGQAPKQVVQPVEQPEGWAGQGSSAPMPRAMMPSSPPNRGAALAAPQAASRSTAMPMASAGAPPSGGSYGGSRSTDAGGFDTFDCELREEAAMPRRQSKARARKGGGGGLFKKIGDLLTGGGSGRDREATGQQGAPAAPTHHLRLKVHHPDGTTEELTAPKPMPGEAVFVIGRGRGCDVVLSQAGVDRRHAELKWDGTQYWIRDLGSTGGVTVNGQLLVAHQWRGLQAGDEVQIAGLTLEILDAPPGPTPRPGAGDREDFWK